MATRKKPSAAGPEIEDDRLYEVHVTEAFTYRRASFGTLVRTQARGAFLTEVLASEHADKVEGYTLVEAD